MSVFNVKTKVSALFVGLLISSISSFSFAEEASATKLAEDSAKSVSASSNLNESLITRLASMGVDHGTVSESPIKGLYEFYSQGKMYYISEDARYLVAGTIFDFDNEMKNVTAEKTAELRKQNTAKHFVKLKDFEKDMIVYKADNEKFVVTAFTDTSCPYCQKLHSEMADYNKLGITIRYMAFPRGGQESNAYNTMVSIWCSDDPKSAMEAAKNNGKLEYKTCDNTVFEQYQLGLALGVNGTPSLFLEDGTMLPGYLPADRLLQVLEEKK